jgi:hypothetical protein
MKPEHVTLLDYYAAHAPAAPLWDFPLRGIGKRPEVVIERGQYPRGDECTNRIELSEYDDARAKAKRVQWPYVWAQAMLDERLNHI